jgi:hypothetical protein
VPPLDQELDGTSATDDSVSRVYNYGDVTAATAGQTGGGDEKDSYGLITRFNTISAVSRKTHGAAGTFDISLPLLGTPGIECRSGGATNDHEIVVTFGTPVIISGAEVTGGTGSVSSTHTSGNQVFVDLTGVTNTQTIQVTLFAVNDGTATNNVTIPMSLLLGDVNATTVVDSGDVFLVRQQTGQTTNSANFRKDVNASGLIDSGDVFLTRQQTGSSLSTLP